LSSASPVGIIQHGQLARYPRLQPFQHCHRSGQRRIWHRPTENFADHHRQLPGLLNRRAHLSGGVLDSGGARLSQGTLLVAAKHQRRQFPAASIGQQPD
jgi:hypothetical protein